MADALNYTVALAEIVVAIIAIWFGGPLVLAGFLLGWAFSITLRVIHATHPSKGSVNN